MPLRAPSQVDLTIDGAFLDEDELLGTIEPPLKKRRKNATPCGSSVEERQFAYLSRAGEGAPTTWRGHQIYKMATRKNFLFADNQIRTSTCWSGLARFIEDPKKHEWQHWSRHPGLGFGVDGESANLCAMSCLIWHFKANTWVWYDPPHAVKCCWENFSKSMKWWDF